MTSMTIALQNTVILTWWHGCPLVNAPAKPVACASPAPPRARASPSCSARQSTCTSDLLHASNVTSKNFTRSSLAAFTQRAAAIAWLSRSTHVEYGQSRMYQVHPTRQQQESHSIIRGPVCPSALRWREGQGRGEKEEGSCHAN